MDSKIEMLIAKTLDALDVEYEYGIKDLLIYHIKPDFKLKINNKIYYLEHLGLMNKKSYRERWHRKFQTYTKLNLAEVLITTCESSTPNIEENIKTIINNIKNNNLKITEGTYSLYYYEL